MQGIFRRWSVQHHIRNLMHLYAFRSRIITQGSQFFCQYDGEQFAKTIWRCCFGAVLLFHAESSHRAGRVLYIIGIGAESVVAKILTGGPDRLHQFCLASVTGRIVTLRQLALVKTAYTPCIGNSCFRLLKAGDVALEHLIIGGIHHIIGFICIRFAQHIGTGGNGLSFQGFYRKGIAHLIGNNTQQIILHMNVQHRVQFAFVYGQMQISQIQRIKAGAIETQTLFSLRPIRRITAQIYRVPKAQR